MVVCKYCGREMLKAKGCVKIPYDSGNKKYDPIKVGSEYFYPIEPGERCGDCGAMYGHYHHPGCDIEECPKCRGQAISCGCFLED